MIEELPVCVSLRIFVKAFLDMLTDFNDDRQPFVGLHGGSLRLRLC